MNKLKLLFNKLHLNFYKELLIIIVFNLITIALCISFYILFKSFNYIILLVIALLIINFAFIYRYILLNNKNNLSYLNELLQAFRFFYLDINNKVNPINALVNVKENCSINLSDNIVLLLDDIKKDKSFIPFVKFSNKYPSLIVESLMLAIYQLINNYNFDNICNFNNTYKQFETKIVEVSQSSFKKQFSFISVTPVIGTMIITLLVIIGTILLVRGYING